MTPTASLQFQRAVRGLPFKAVYTFGLDDDALPDGAPTYAVVNAEGTTVASGTATLVGSVASFNLAASLLPLRDLLTVTWSYTVAAAPVAVTSTIDVCDARLFPASDWGQFNDKQVTSASTATLEEARTDAENYLERECGCAFTGRYGSELWLLEGHRANFINGVGFSGFGWGGSYREQRTHNQLALRMPFVSDIRSITRAWVDPDDGTSGTHALNLNYVQLDAHTSTIYAHRDPTDQYGGLWGELTIAYEHGRPLADVRRICLILARYRVINGPLERRAVTMPVEGGGSVQLLTPGMAASVTGIPEVDAFINRYNARVDGFLGG